MGSNQNENESTSKQIGVYKTGNGLVELLDFLAPASKKYYAQLHASIRQDEGERSYVKVNMLDYSKGTGEKCVNVSYNISPEEVKYLFSRVSGGAEIVTFEHEKIFGEPDKEGLSIVRKIRINRKEKNGSGEKMNYPWNMEIQNGSGRAEKNKNGGAYCKKGSYKADGVVKVNLTDEDFFALFCKGDSFIRAFELEHAYKDNRVGNFKSLYNLIIRALDERLGETVKKAG